MTIETYEKLNETGRKRKEKEKEKNNMVDV